MPRPLDVGHATAPGNRYGALNQDYAVVRRAFFDAAADGAGAGLEPLTVAAVLDGHGMCGERAARMAGDACVDAVIAAARRAAPAPLLGCGGSGGGGGGDDSDGGQQDEQQQQRQLAEALSGAFTAAHKAALGVYDDPPDAITYPTGNAGGSNGSGNGVASTVFRLVQRATPGGLPPCYRAASAGSGDLSNAVAAAHLSNGHALCGALAAAAASAAASERPLECGATCTLAVVQGGVLAVANVGDTSAVLVSVPDGPDGDVAARFVTTDHNGHNGDEAARIAAGFGQVACITADRGYLAVRAGPSAGYQLSVTRAVGHKSLAAAGVTCEPAVAARRLRAGDVALVVASDGVWDVMGAREAAHRVLDVLSAGGSAEAAARQLVDDAVRLAECSPGGDADNTTALVIVFDE